MQIRTRKQQIQELAAENKRLVKTQELLVDNILSLQSQEATYTGNRFKTYESAVLELDKKYSGKSDWGVVQAGSIVDIRAAYTAGQGIKISAAAPEGVDATREIAFAQRFIDKNELDHELIQDLAREAEIEGKTLIKLIPTPDPAAFEAPGGSTGTDIAIRWISWVTTKYKVNVNKSDYLQIENVEWNREDGGKAELNPSQFVYKRFAGRLNIPDETMPRTAKCLTQIEDLDKALRDWRQIDKLFAAPTPHIQCDSSQQAKDIDSKIANSNWKVGHFLAHTGVFAFAQPSSEGQKAIESEIITLMKLISGATGVPIHFLGAPELTTKYGANNEGLLELITMSTAKDREIWRAAYQELLDKAMRLWNETTHKTPLRPGLVKVDLPLITKEQWDRIASIWLLLRSSKEISRKTLLSQIPGLDVETEIKALTEEEDEALQKFRDQKTDTRENDAENDADENRPFAESGE